MQTWGNADNVRDQTVRTCQIPPQTAHDYRETACSGSRAVGVQTAKRQCTKGNVYMSILVWRYVGVQAAKRRCTKGNIYVSILVWRYVGVQAAKSSVPKVMYTCLHLCGGTCSEFFVI